MRRALVAIHAAPQPAVPKAFGF